MFCQVTPTFCYAVNDIFLCEILLKMLLALIYKKKKFPESFKKFLTFYVITNYININKVTPFLKFFARKLN